MMTLEFPLRREIMTTVRLTAGGIASLAGFGLDASEDFKVAVTESLLLLLHGGCDGAKVRFMREEGVRVEIEGRGGVPSRERTVEEEISAALLSALVEDLVMERGEVFRISFVCKGN